MAIFRNAPTKAWQARVSASGWGFAFCLTLLAGCAEQGAELIGAVTLDGAPLDDATITFVPLAGTQRQAAWSSVDDGHYRIDAKSGLGTGQFRVEIRALRAVAGKSNPIDPEIVPGKEAVPSRYNSQSELTVDIKPGQNKADFILKSK